MGNKWTAPDVESKLLRFVLNPSQDDVVDARDIAPALTKFTKIEIKIFAKWFFNGSSCPESIIRKAVKQLDQWEYNLVDD